MIDVEKYLMNIKGKQYLPVNARIAWFRSEHPQWNIQTEVIQCDKDMAVVKADVYDDAGKHVSSGLGMEERKVFPAYLEKAETAAVGRALAMLGYGTLQCLELEEESRICDAPVTNNIKTKFQGAYAKIN